MCVKPVQAVFEWMELMLLSGFSGISADTDLAKARWIFGAKTNWKRSLYPIRALMICHLHFHFQRKQMCSFIRRQLRFISPRLGFIFAIWVACQCISRDRIRPICSPILLKTCRWLNYMTLPDVKVVNFASKYIMYLLPLEVTVPLTSTLRRPQVLLNSFCNIKDNEQRKARSLSAHNLPALSLAFV